MTWHAKLDLDYRTEAGRSVARHLHTGPLRILQSFYPEGDGICHKVLAAATLYSSAEPCVMCAGAIFWFNIGRVIFGIDAVSLRSFRGEGAEQCDAELSCRDVFAASPHSIECIGPVMVAEASEPHVGFWKI